MKILEERKPQVYRKGAEPFQLDCNKQSVAGSVSQRACVFCGSRVVLYPIADALHMVHGPLGCASIPGTFAARSLPVRSCIA
jgi:nitrogenase molybdenum-cofactor synthesis protein NifE